MQIDMHFGGTYVVARAAGFSHAEALLIANSAQYVDDATTTGFVRFDNAALYQRTATAHKMLSGDNLDDLANHLAWLPFHFLPGNGGQPAGQGTGTLYADRLICTPNSPVAQDVIANCIAKRGEAYGLYLLGITAHVFVDTYAHQGFAGMIHRVNVVSDIESADPSVSESWTTEVQNLWGKVTDKGVMLGHGLAHTYPDYPWLSWRYKNGHEEAVDRDNLSIFIDAMDELCKVFQRYRLGDANANAAVDGLPATVHAALLANLQAITDEDGGDRLDRWLTLLQNDAFGFGAEAVAYTATGWRYDAIGTTEEMGENTWEDVKVLPYPPNFPTTDWKLFHDAAKEHRHAVIEQILPRYGLCAA